MKFQDLHQFERKCVAVISGSLAYQHQPIIAYSEKQNINRLPVPRKQTKFVQRGSYIHKFKGKFISVSSSAMHAVVCS